MLYENLSLRSTAARQVDVDGRVGVPRLASQRRRRRAGCEPGVFLHEPAEHPFVSYIIRIGRALCKITPALSAWGLSPHDSPLSAEGVEQVPEPCDGIAHLGTRPVEP